MRTYIRIVWNHFFISLLWPLLVFFECLWVGLAAILLALSMIGLTVYLVFALEMSLILAATLVYVLGVYLFLGASLIEFHMSLWRNKKAQREDKREQEHYE